MKHEKKKIGRNETRRNLILGALTMPILFLLFSLLSCAICYAGKIPTSKIDILSTLSLFASGGIGAFIISRLDRNGSIALPIFNSLLFVALFILMAFIVNGRLSASNLMNILCLLLICCFFSFLGKTKREKKHKRRN